MSAKKPDIFGFHDYREYLKAWLSHAKASRRVFSLRALSKQAQLASGYLPMVLSGARPLSPKALRKLLPCLELGKTERAYLETLVQLGTSDSQELRVDALDRMKRFRSYRELNPRELEVYQYLTRWYYVAIREMTAMPGFRADPTWIQARLRARIPVSEIQAALEFLSKNGFIEILPDGSARPPEKDLSCLGGVYRVALSQYHREIFNLAAQSIENTPSSERLIVGHSFAIDSAQFDRAREIINEALSKIQALKKAQEPGESVYHVELALFPLTARPPAESRVASSSRRKKS